MGNRLRSSLLGHPAPSKWVRLRSSMVESLDRYPDGEPVGVSGLNCTMPNGTTAPGYVEPPAPPGTGLGALLSSVPMKGLTNWVRLSVAACASGAATRVMAAADAHRPAAGRIRPMGASAGGADAGQPATSGAATRTVRAYRKRGWISAAAPRQPAAGPSPPV